MQVDWDIYNDARYCTTNSLKKLLLSIKNGLEVQLYSMYSITDNNLEKIKLYLFSFESFVLNDNVISSYCLQFAAWLASMYKFQEGENVSLINRIQEILETFQSIAKLKLAELVNFKITPAMQQQAAEFFRNNPGKAISDPAKVILDRPELVIPYGQYTEIVINTSTPMKVRVPFGAIVTIDHRTGLYRYNVPNMPTHGKVYIWPENVNHTFGFGVRVEFTPSNNGLSIKPITDFDSLSPMLDANGTMALFGKVVVLPLTYESIEVPLPDKMETTIKIYDNTTEIRAVCVPNTTNIGIFTVVYGDGKETMQLLNPTDLAVLSHSGEVLYISNQYMPFNEQVVPIKVENALADIDDDVPDAMENLPTPPVMPEPLVMTAFNIEALNTQVFVAMGNIQRASYAIETKGSTIYAHVLNAQASEVYTSVVRLLNFDEIIKDILSLMKQLNDEAAHLTDMLDYDWLNPKQYDDLFITVSENRAIASQGIAIAYSILVMDAVYKQKILSLWNESLLNNNNSALLALQQMRDNARQELLSYGVVFSESAILPTAELIDAIVFPKVNKPIETTKKEEKSSIGWIVALSTFLGIGFIIFVIVMYTNRKRKQKAQRDE